MSRLIGFVLVLGIAIGSSGCKLIDELRTFNLNYSTEITIPSSTVIALPIDLPGPTVTTNSEQRFEDEGVKSAWVESVKLKGLMLTITSPEGKNFNFLEDIAIYISTDNQQEILLASKIPVPEGSGSSIALEVGGADLYPYISQDDFSLRTMATTDESITQDVELRADMIFEVKATIPGGN